MYLAEKHINGETHYFIRESYPADGIYLSRNLLNLGRHPERLVEYPGGNAYYVSESVVDALASSAKMFDPEEVEDLFWRFVRPDIRHAQEHFRHRGRTRSDKKRATPEPSPRPHLFDRRRVHFLRYGQMDQGGIGRVSPKLFQALEHKSRDEIEQYFMASERILKPHEIKSYVFVIFDMQRHFAESFAKTMPQALDQRAVDTFFIQEICRLNDDLKFWGGNATGDRLHEYLIRYVIMFFDSEYGRSRHLEDLLWSWVNRNREYRPPPSARPMSMGEASTVFGMPESELRQMNRRELARVFRKKARECHPDQGGDPEAFIKLSEAYQGLRERKK